MVSTNRKFKEPSGEHHSVLDGREYIRGLPHEKPSPFEEARQHPEQARDCKSVLDGPACIRGMPR